MRNLIIMICLSTGVFSYAQSLETLVQEALDKNPSIEKLNLQYELAKEKINEVNTLPNTEFEFGYMAIKPEMDMPMTRFSVSAMQMFPWFGTIEAKEKYTSSLADTKAVDISIAQKKLSLSIAQIYYQIYEIEAQQDVLRENIALLETFEKLALSSVKVGKASSVDVLRLQIQQNEMEQEVDVLSKKRLGLEAALNSLINRDDNMPIHVDSSLSLPESEPIYSVESLKDHPELRKLDKTKASIEQSELVNQKESKPMFGVGIEYLNQTDSPLVSSSFKDMIMPMVTLSIPIFNHKYKSISIQNDLKQQEIEAEKNNQLNVFKAELAKAVTAIQQAKIKYKTQQDNLEIAKNAQKILLKNYETGTIDYDEVLKIQALALKFEKNQISAIKQYHEQMALINYLTELEK